MNRYTEYIRAVAQKRDPFRVFLEYVGECEKRGRGHTLDTKVFSAAMAATARKRMFDDTHAIYKIMTSRYSVQAPPNIFTYNALLSGADIFSASEIIAKMQYDNIQPSIHTYSMMIRLLVGSNERSAAMFIFNSMSLPSATVQPEAKTLQSALSAVGSVEEGLVFTRYHKLYQPAIVEALYKKCRTQDDLNKVELQLATVLSDVGDFRSFYYKMEAWNRAGLHSDVILMWDSAVFDVSSTAAKCDKTMLASVFLYSIASIDDVSVITSTRFFQGITTPTPTPSIEDAKKGIVGAVREYLLTMDERVSSRQKGKMNRIARAELAVFASIGDGKGAREVIRNIQRTKSQHLTYGLITMFETAAINGGQYWMLHDAYHQGRSAMLPLGANLPYPWDPWAKHDPPSPMEPREAEEDALRERLCTNRSLARRLLFARGCPVE